MSPEPQSRGCPDRRRENDPYLSRPNLDEPIVPDAEAIARHAPARADLILIGHSHVDHLLDAPAIALRSGAEVLGSESTTMVGLASGVPAARLITVKGGEVSPARLRHPLRRLACPTSDHGPLPHGRRARVRRGSRSMLAGDAAGGAAALRAHGAVSGTSLRGHLDIVDAERDRHRASGGTTALQR